MSSTGDCVPMDVQVIVIMRHGERADDAPGAPTLSVGGGSSGGGEMDPLNPPLTVTGAKYIENEAASSIQKAISGLYGGGRVPLSTVASPFLRCAQTAVAVSTGLLLAQSNEDVATTATHGSPNNNQQEDPIVDIDYRLSEVCGPIRIKGVPASEPTTQPSSILSSSIASRGGGGGGAEGRSTIYKKRKWIEGSNDPSLTLPVWGEGVQQAQVRFVSALQSISRGVHRRNAHDPKMPRHALLVTHGDALSSIIGALFPGLTVYEVLYGGFIVIEKLRVISTSSPPYGVQLLDSNRYRIVHSEGVSWLEGEGGEAEGVRESFTKMVGGRKGPFSHSDSDDPNTEEDRPKSFDASKSLSSSSSPTSPTNSSSAMSGVGSAWARIVLPLLVLGFACGLTQSALGVANVMGTSSVVQVYVSMGLLAAADLFRFVHLVSVLVVTGSGDSNGSRLSFRGASFSWLWRFGKRFGTTFDRTLENEILTFLSRFGVNLAQYHVLSRTPRLGRPSTDRSPLLTTSSHSSGSSFIPLIALTILVGLKTVAYLILYNGCAMLLSGLVAVAGPLSWKASCWESYFNADVSVVPTWLQPVLFAVNMLCCLLAVAGMVYDRVHN